MLSKTIMPVSEYSEFAPSLPPPPVTVSRVSETATRTMPDPLAPAQLEAEEALGQHGQEHQAAGKHGLADRDRGQRQCGHVEGERHRRHAPADAPPARPEQVGGAAHRVTHVHVRGLDGTALLQKEGQVGPERRQQRAEEADADGHGEAGHRETGGRGVHGVGGAYPGGQGSTTSLRGSIRILAWVSAAPSASNARSTPSRPTVPVTSGEASTLPSASMCSVSRYSSGV